MPARLIARLLCCCLLLLATTCALADVPGALDHPLMSRFPGAEVDGYAHLDFDQAFLPDRPIDAEDQAKGLTVEGAITRHNYLVKGNKSTLEVERNYLSALQKAGFKMLFRCAQDSCGATSGVTFQAFVVNSGKVRPPGFGAANFGGAHRALLARLTRSAGDVYVFLDFMDDLASNQQVVVYQQIVEQKPMDDGQVVVDASGLQQSLKRDGRVALYGIYFDTDKASLKPESRPQLEQIAGLLRANAGLRLFVVGHTDNQGSYPHNAELSQRRAEEVVRALVSDGHVDAARLVAKGVASLAPLASNADESGRARNRRVELVPQ